jgi:hypothetical protein
MSDPPEDKKPEPEAPVAPPEPSFRHIVDTFAIPAMIWTGQIRSPVDQDLEPNLELAKYHIGLLEVLEQKSKGNLDADEENYLAEMLSTARLAYIRSPLQQGEQKPAQVAPAAGEQVESKEQPPPKEEKEEEE